MAATRADEETRKAMARIDLATSIRAVPEVCFDRARDLDLHLKSLSHTSEQAIAGRTTGLIEMGEEVTWRGRHFGIMHEHRSRITAFDRPNHFRDEMVGGRFTRFVHDHYFVRTSFGTEMRDVLEFQSPLGILGRAVDRLILTRYLVTLLKNRNSAIRQAAES